MKILKSPLIVAILVFLNSCSPRIMTNVSKSYQALDYRENVIVLGIDEKVPEYSEVLGQVKIGDTGFSINCGYEVAIDKAKLEARKIGGNAIKITEHKLPSAFGSSCHRITAEILRILDIEEYKLNQEDDDIDTNIDYAILNVYRYGGPGALVSYDIHLGDSVICRVKNKFKTTLHIKKVGLNTLWAKTESKVEVPIDLQKGKTYYLKCGVSMGAFVGRPKIDLVDSKTGKAEFDSFTARNK